MLLALFLLLQLRVRLVAVYQAGGPQLRAGAGPVSIAIYPRPAPSARKLERAAKAALRRRVKAEKRAQKKAQKQTKPEEALPEEKTPIGDTIELLRALLPIALEAVGRLRRKLLIRELRIHLNWGARDPADAAVGYGLAHGVMASILPLLEASFRVKKTDTIINLDYGLEKPNIYLKAHVSISLMQAAALGIFAARKGLGAYLAHRKEKRAREGARPKGKARAARPAR